MSSSIDAGLGLFPAQQGVWFAQQLMADSAVFNIGQLVWFDGPIDPAVLETAWRRTWRDSETLRTRFALVADQPVIHLTDDEAPWAVVDAGGRDTDDVRGLAHAELAQVRDMLGAELVGSVLFRLDDNRSGWFLRIHHILIDAYGLSLISKRVAEVYSALTAGREVPDTYFAALTDVATGTRRTGDQVEADRSFWTSVVRGRGVARSMATGAHPLSPVNPRFPIRAGRGVPEDTTTAVQSLADETGSTWADVVILGWAAFVARVLDSDHVTFGLPMMGRAGPAALKTPMLAANILPLHVDLPRRQTISDSLRHVVENVRGIRQHQAYRAEDVARDNALVGTSEMLYGTFLNIKAFDYRLQFGDVAGVQESVETGPVADVAPSVYNDPVHGFSFTFDANPDLWSPSELEALSERFTEFFARFVRAGADASLGSVSAVSDAEHAMLSAWSAAPGPEIDFTSITDRFVNHAHAAPDSVALTVDGTDTTYRQLACESNGLTRALIARGVGPESRVALLMPRTGEMVTAILGVLGAGACCVPIDPVYPVARVEFMIDDAEPDLIITTQTTADQWSEVLARSGAQQLVLDDSETRVVLTQQSDEPVDPVELPTPLRPSHLAYLIYTSGSTGRPKSVAGTHGALANRLDWAAQAWCVEGTGVRDVRLAKSSISFIDGLTELLGALLSGARSILADEDTVTDAAAMTRMIGEHHITQLTAVPALHRTITEVGGDSVSGVRRWIASGAALPATVVNELLATAAGSVIVNSYGSSEVAGDVAYAEFSAAVEGDVPIGRPVPGATTRVLDRGLAQAPPGVVGELYVGGVQVARGYWRQPATTASRFVPDPWGVPGSRMYRTGDLAMWNPDGQLIYCGRVDHQVKIRGHRVELGEIESTLVAEKGVRDAAVVVHAGGGADGVLVGYLTQADSSAPPLDTAAIKQTLTRTLPAHMVPAALVVLEEFPTTASGKPDRTALARRDFRPDTDGSRPARTGTEATVAELFSDVLGIERAGFSDDFFALGGHSLIATRLLARLSGDLGVTLSMRDVFDNPTIEMLAALVESHAGRSSGQASSALSSAPELTALRPRPEAIGLSAAQMRLWFMFELAGPSPVYNVSIPLRVNGRLDRRTLTAAVGAVLAKHEPLRTVFAEGESGPEQRLLPVDDLDAVVTFREGEDESGFVAECVSYCFDLTREAPVRLTVLERADGTAILCVVVHHIAFDQWSVPIFFADLGRAYRNVEQGETADIGELDVQYADYACWQRSILEADNAAVHPGSRPVSAQLDYWEAQLDELPEELSILTDRPRPADAGTAGFTLGTTFDARVLDALKARCQDAGVTEYILAQTAVALVLDHFGAGSDVPVGTPVAGRGHPAVENLIGFFVNTLVIRNDLSGDPLVDEVLQRAKRVVLDALDNQDAPFESVVERVDPDRSMARHPLFQTMVVYRNARGLPEDLGGAPIDLIRTTATTAKFDLEFEFVELGDGTLAVDVVFAADLFETATAQRYVDTLARVIRALTDTSPQRISDIAHDDADRRRTLGWARSTESAVPVHTLDGLFADQARRRPESVALAQGDDRWTYRRLARDSARLARLMIAQGVGAGDRVAVIAPRTPQLVSMIVATLATGAAYVPVDPAYPAARIDYLLKDSQPSLVLVHGDDQRDVAAAVMGVPTIVLSDPAVIEDLERLSAEPITDDDRVRGHRPSDPAYVMYTSGSTGAPKGVIVPHQNVVALFAATADMGFDHTDVWTLFHSYSFDFSVWEIWGPLTSGATLVVVDHETTRDATAFGDLLRAQRVTVLNQTPSAFYALAESERERTDGAAPDLRMVIFGGEALDFRRLDTWYQKYSAKDVRLVNMFGITETTVHTTVHPIEGRKSLGASVIGRPLTNLRTTLLDHRLQPVPVGVTGELYVAGPQVAQGYWQRPDLTSTRFVADPDGTGTVLYRTGDLMRWNDEGLLEYVSRADQQVKIRGFRIELDEVAAAVEAHPLVASAVVIVRTNERSEANEQYMSGYWIRAGGPATSDEVDERTLREHVANSLPAHMVPTFLTRLERFPLTVNGKLDRRALPEPRLANADHNGARQPEGVAETAVARAFEAVLGLESVSADADFFHLGGDSISALAVVRHAKAHGAVTTARKMFDHRTVEAIAADAEQPDAVDTGARTRTRPPHRPTSMMPIMHRQLTSGIDQSAFRHTRLIAAPYDVDLERLQWALDNVIARHGALWLQVDQGTPATVVMADTSPGSTPVESFDAAGLSDDDLLALVRQVDEESARRLNLSAGELTHLVHFDRGAATGVLAWTVHHFAVDFVSWEILIGDLRQSYENGPEAGSDAGVAVDRTFFDWMEHLNTETTIERFRAEAEHWLTEIGSVGGGGSRGDHLDDPPGSVAPAMSTGAFARDSAEKIAAAAAHSDGFIRSVLLAGLVLVLQGRSVQGEQGAERSGVLVDLEGHGRSADPDGPTIDGTVGWMTTVTPIAVRVSGETAGGFTTSPVAGLDALVEVERALESIPGDGLGFGVLRYLDDAHRQQLEEMHRATVQFNYGGVSAPPVGDGVWSTPVGLPPLIATDPGLGTPHPLTVNIAGRRSGAGTDFSFSLSSGDAEYADALDEIAAEWERAVVSLVDVYSAAGRLNRPAGLGPDRSATAVVPTVNQHRLRASGLPLGDFIVTGVLDVESLPKRRDLEVVLARMVVDHDALRQRVTTRGRVWLTEVVPVSYTDVAQSVSFFTLDSERSDAVAKVADEIAEGLDISVGSTLQVAVVTSASGHHLVAAAHALAVDRRSLDTLMGVLSQESSASKGGGEEVAGEEVTSSVVDVAEALNELAQALSGVDETADESALPDLSDAVGECHRWVDVVSDAGTLEVEEAFARVVRSSAKEASPLPTAFDIDADLRQLLDDTDGESNRQVLPSQNAVGWWTTSAPASADGPLPEQSARPWYMLRRFGTRAGRAQGKKKAGRQVLLTRSFGESARPAEREASEQFYRIVFRYQLVEGDNGGSTVRLGVVGSSDEHARRWITAWAHELTEGPQR